MNMSDEPVLHNKNPESRNQIQISMRNKLKKFYMYCRKEFTTNKLQHITKIKLIKRYQMKPLAVLSSKNQHLNVWMIADADIIRFAYHDENICEINIKPDIYNGIVLTPAQLENGLNLQLALTEFTK